MGDVWQMVKKQKNESLSDPHRLYFDCHTRYASTGQSRDMSTQLQYFLDLCFIKDPEQRPTASNFWSMGCSRDPWLIKKK
jgi:hypothetical protein